MTLEEYKKIASLSLLDFLYKKASFQPLVNKVMKNITTEQNNPLNKKIIQMTKSEGSQQKDLGIKISNNSRRYLHIIGK